MNTNIFPMEVIGLRSLVDEFIFLRHFGEKIDYKYIKKEIEELGMSDFEEGKRNISEKLFSAGEELSDEEKKLLDYYIFSGSFGTVENRVNVKLKEKKSDYIFHRLFLSDERLKTYFPFFYKHKILLPFLLIYRIGTALTTKRKSVFAELSAINKYDKKG